MKSRARWLRRLGATALGALAVASTAACAGSQNYSATNGSAAESVPSLRDNPIAGVSFDVPRDPGCGCCKSWVEYLRTHGALVEIAEDAERTSFRADRGIVDEAASCHTTIVDGYTIEGHVPVGAIKRLRSERPDAVGLALPGMPVDAPGMGGNATDWESQRVLLIGAGGAHSEFEY